MRIHRRSATQSSHKDDSAESGHRQDRRLGHNCHHHVEAAEVVCVGTPIRRVEVLIVESQKEPAPRQHDLVIRSTDISDTIARCACRNCRAGADRGRPANFPNQADHGSVRIHIQREILLAVPIRPARPGHRMVCIKIFNGPRRRDQELVSGRDIDSGVIPRNIHRHLQIVDSALSAVNAHEHRYDRKGLKNSLKAHDCWFHSRLHIRYPLKTLFSHEKCSGKSEIVSTSRKHAALVGTRAVN